MIAIIGFYQRNEKYIYIVYLFENIINNIAIRVYILGYTIVRKQGKVQITATIVAIR